MFFIFSIKSDKASKQLKGRSKFVEKQTTEIWKSIKKWFKSAELIYDGGGNIYALVGDVSESEFIDLQEFPLNSIYKIDRKALLQLYLNRN